MKKYWDSYFDLSIIADEVSYGQLVLDCYYSKDGLSFSDFFLSQARFFESAFGEVCESVTVSKQISAKSQAIYNKGAWDESTLGAIDEDTIVDSHEATIDGTLRRMEKYRVNKIGLGYMAKWKNPYIRTGDQFRWGVNITFQYRKDHMMVRLNFSKPSMWFSTNFRPLFPSDKFVREYPKLPYNKNERGVIVPLESLIHDNRLKLLGILAGMHKAASPRVMLLAYTNVKFSPAGRKVVVPKAQLDDENKQALFVGHKLESGIELADAKGGHVPASIFVKRVIDGVSFMIEESHFGFITEEARRL